MRSAECEEKDSHQNNLHGDKSNKLPPLCFESLDLSPVYGITPAWNERIAHSRLSSVSPVWYDSVINPIAGIHRL